MAEFKLGRIRFVWKNDWATSTTYYKDDVVKYGGRVFICITGHTASPSFYTDLNAVPSKWNQMSDGQTWAGTWATSTDYKVNDIVKYGGMVYICQTAHTSAATAALGLEANIGNWDLVAEGFDWKGNWVTATRYKLNDIVKYGGYTYVCSTYHTSNLTLDADLANWDVFNAGVEYKGAWSGSSVYYKVNDVVKYGGNIWICTTAHTSSASFNTSNFALFVEGVQYESTWSSATTYQPGDIVSYGGNQYFAKTVHSNSTPSTGTTNWDLFSRGLSFQSDWSGSTAYKIGEVVRLGGYTYLCIEDNTNQTPPNATYWERLTTGVRWRGDWTESTDYVLGDTVRFDTNVYICVLGHTSDDGDSTITPTINSPQKDVTGTYWNIFNVGSDTSIMTNPGDMVYFNNGPKRLPVGTEGQVLKVNASLLPEWDYLGVIDHVYYVAPNGTDGAAPTYGRTLDKPWKTVRYAAEQIENGCRNPNAQRLLELNRVFIQREVTKWIEHQIATATVGGTWYNYDYDEYKCERDVGFIVDRLIADLGHGGNLKTRAAAQTYVNALSSGPFSNADDSNGTGTYSRLAIESDKDVLAFNYMLTVISSVLNQTVVSVNYQALRGDASTAVVTQTYDTTITAESGTYTTVQSLVKIITDALTAGNATTIPDRIVPGNIIFVKSGTYEETLPIIVPEGTAVIGDETRAVTINATGSLVHKTDALANIGALGRLETVVGQVILGTTVTPTTGNTTSQSQSWPYASSVEQTTIKQLVRTMEHRIDWSLNTMHLANMTDPTGYNTSYLVGYGDARKLLRVNKDFIKAEIVAWINTNYPTLKYSKTSTKRDTGYIIDALIYDLTYGGNSRSIEAGLAYYDGPLGASQIASSEQTATVAAIARLKSLMQSVATASPIGTLSQTTVPQVLDTAGSAGASTFIGTNMDIIYNLVNAGSTTGAPNITVTSITGANTLNTTAAHGLSAGDVIIPRTTNYGLTASTTYYVISAGLTSTAFRVATSYDGSAIGTLTTGSGYTYVVDYVNRPAATNAVTSTTALITAFTTLSAAAGTIATNVNTYITTNYPSLSFNSTKSIRDTKTIIDAVGYDAMFNSNYQTIKAAYSFLRSTASEVFSLGEKSACIAAFGYLSTQMQSNVGGDSTTQSRISTLITTLTDIVYGATNEGSTCQTELRSADYACLQLERNRSFILAEINAYIANTYKATVTATTVTTNVITCSDTSWMQRNLAIRFSGTLPSATGLDTTTTYYVQKVVSSTTFTVATIRDATDAQQVTLATKSGSWTVSMYYNATLCQRDVGRYIDALKYDMKWPGNYKSRFAARYYVNAVLGSNEEDMFYMRNSTGIKNLTLTGLRGDVLPANSYGTSRVSAGAYASLDPGWGPADFRTWIFNRSPYLQNCATFGYAAVGQKIDGALHNGGNDSIVSNDFTQLISDGIGAWVTNNGRAELVSVFTYYSYIGYLAENGGRIRGTNGNNSYGVFGSVAEGFDTSETAGGAIVDNKYQFKAVVGKVQTNLTAVYGYEFDHAGNDYSKITWLLVGPGNFVSVEADEFRDDAVYQVRMLDNVDDSTNAPEADGNIGGYGYVFKSNSAQSGTTTSLTLAATDDALSSTYVGMKLWITAGAGIGNFGIISSYVPGTKVASVVKESDGTPGWDHYVAGTTIVTPDSSSSYQIEPAIQFTAPGYTSTASTLPTSGTWTSVVFGDTSNIYTGLTGTYSGTGATGATWTVAVNGFEYKIVNDTAGTGYTRLQTITIPGTSLGGTSTTNDLVITITSVNSVTGAIQAWDQSGYGPVGRYVAVRSGSQVGATSEDGINWTTRATLMPSGAAWTNLAYGKYDDGSTLGVSSKFVAVAGGGATTNAAYSYDGLTWTATTMTTSATWVDVCFGNGAFVAIASDSTTVRISYDGEVWDTTGTLPTTGYTAVAYGGGKYVAVKSGTTSAAYSSDGKTWTAVTTLPSTAAWGKISFGNNRFVTIATGAGTSAAYSLDWGATWTAVSIPSATWNNITYGQGLFFAVSNSTVAASSPDGVTWTTRTTSTAASGFSDITFGNPNRYGLFVGVGGGTGTVGTYIRTGATARGRAYVTSNKIASIKILEPGSGYASAPTITIVDPNNTYEAPTQIRIGDGVLATPSFKNRGTGYQTCSAEVDTGNGYADNYQNGSYLAVRRITSRPVAGSNVVIAGLDGTYKLVSVVSFSGQYDGSYTAFYQISPQIKVIQSVADSTAITTRIRYSQVRLTGHDFLNIGTGNTADTNYPNTPVNNPSQANEVVENNGGRVFYTSTDQDGNFRVGELFTVEQSTGVATLNADAFNVAGLQELSLGNLSLSGNSATITEFSTDPFFTADSDSVVPTQRAIKAYIASQIGGGGAALIVNSVTAGSIFISTNQITTTNSSTITMNGRFEFRGSVSGYPLAWNYYLT